MAISPVILLQGAGVAGLLVAVATDLKARIIPNSVVLWVLGVGGLSRWLVDGLALWVSLPVAVLVFLPLAFLAQRELLGGGDAKLIAASTLLVRPVQALDMILAIALAGGVLAVATAIVILARRQTVRPEPADRRRGDSASTHSMFTGPPSTVAQGQMPYAVAILAGVASTLIRSA